MNRIYDSNGNTYSVSDLRIKKMDKNGKELSYKERMMKAKSLIMVYKKTNRVIFELNMIQNQHFYPLSILDYANVLKNQLKNKTQKLPIMSLDSHDYNFCDFNCKDCLAVDTRNWAKDKLGFTNFEIEHYKKVLDEISRYSRENGLDSIRFEMSGEGNPDMYPFRKELIEYSSVNCNMKCVYITSGSRLNEETIDALAKYAYYIRISLPGVTEEAYQIYSHQNSKTPFRYKNAMDLIKKLVKKRHEYGRDGELMIGARTCMRPENEGSYIETAKKLGKLGADSFQIVKILIPEGEDINKYKLSDNTINELEDIRKNFKKYKLMHVQVPYKLDYMYYDRKIEDDKKPSKCYSSLLSPILYGPHLVICTHYQKIKDVHMSHYGKLTGEKNQLDEIMWDERAEFIRKCVPERCSSCCAIFDNQVLEMICSQLKLVDNYDDVEFYLTY